MIQVGNNPRIECSSRGDKRFSAFHAKIDGKSIEEQYQAAKEFDNGITGLGWREAKGKTPINYKEVSKLYKDLWRRYLLENPELITVLINAKGLSDMFGQRGHNCQAVTLWELREEFIKDEEGTTRPAGSKVSDRV